MKNITRYKLGLSARFNTFTKLRGESKDTLEINIVENSHSINTIFLRSGSFVDKIGTSVENDAIIQTIISLAKSLNLTTVAEGIETDEQFQFLKNAQVDYAQGYLFAKPLSEIELEKLIQKELDKNGSELG